MTRSVVYNAENRPVNWQCGATNIVMKERGTVPNFAAPKPIPLMKISYQVAQKIHGATDKESVRANDLIDLQYV